MKALAIVALALATFLMGCDKAQREQVDTDSEEYIRPADNSYNLNLSIFLDLSDRISPVLHPNSSMEYFQWDLGYLNSVTMAFEKHLLYKKLILMDERIQLFVDPLPANPEINELIRGLRMNFSKNNTTKERIVSLGSTYAENAAKLYDLAIHDNNFIGSDIWGFFHTKVRDYCIVENYRNVLVIITDGYVYHDDNLILDENMSSYITTRSIAQSGLNTTNWKELMQEKGYGLIATVNGLENLEVLVLGINANRQSPFEEDVIRKYWGDWFTGMGIRKYSIKSADLPTNLDEVIQNFILTP